MTHIDFLSMDIEEAEPQALAGFDIERFKPELVCIEAGAETVRVAITKYFAEHGYHRIEKYREHGGPNWFFAPDGEGEN